MGKGSGNCSTRPSLSFSQDPLPWSKTKEKLEKLLSYPDINLQLGKDWVLKEQERLVEQKLGNEPSKTIKIAQNLEIKKQIQKIIVLKGPLHKDIKELRKKLGGGEIANPKWQIWQDDKKQLLGKKAKINDTQSIWRGEIDALEIAQETVDSLQIELQLLEVEKQVAKEAKKKKDKMKAESYSKWVATSLFGGEKIPEWITLEDGSVVFLGAVDQVAKISHLGVAAKALLNRKDFQVCYRYWSVDKQGRLGAPLHGGSHWAPGINQAALNDKDWKNTTTQGLYAFKHEKDTICAQTYFDIKKGCLTNGGRVMITACLMWDVKTAWGTAVRSKYAAPACVLSLPSDSKEFKAQTDKVAELYHLKKVSLAEKLHDEAKTWFKDSLPDFFKKGA